MVYNTFIEDAEEHYSPPQDNILKIGYVNNKEPGEDRIYLAIGKAIEGNGSEGESFTFQANGQDAMIAVTREDLFRAFLAMGAIDLVIPTK